MYGSISPQPKPNKKIHSQESLSIRIRLEGPRRIKSPSDNTHDDYDDQDDDEDDDDSESSPKRATILSCATNLVNTIVGAGMLGLPGALGGTGYVTGLIMIVLGAAFSANGLVLLTKAAQQAGLPSSFYSVARAAVPEYTVLIDLTVALKCFGVATGYLITVGDCMVDALDHILLLNTTTTTDDDNIPWWVSLVLTRQFWIVGALLAVLPVSFFRTLDALKTASALALTFVFFLVFGIVAYAHGLADPCLDMDEQVCVGPVERVTTIPRTISKLPIFIFSFTCHQNIFPIVNEIRHRSQSRLNIVVLCSIGFALVLFLTVAWEGYFTFGSNVRGDILLNYPETVNVTILRICIAIMVVLSYPLQLDPSRRCITSLIKVIQQWRQRGRWARIFHRRESAGLDDSMILKPTNEVAITTEPSSLSQYSSHIESEDSNGQTTTHYSHDAFMSDDTFYAITASFLLLSFIVAMTVSDLGIVLALVGATGSTLVSYILPGLIYVKIHPIRDLSQILAQVQLVAGCLIMPISLYFVLTGSVHH